MVTIPVRFVNGQWEHFYGGGIPAKEGAMADLVLEQHQLLDNDFAKTLTKTMLVKILEADTVLRVAVSVREEPTRLYGQYLIKPDMKELGDFSLIGQTELRFIEVTVARKLTTRYRSDMPHDGMWLRIKGLQADGIVSTGICVPQEVSKEPLSSLNHAFTKLSEIYEPWRISHTGNVYQRVLYQDTDNLWYPIDDLRDRQLAISERGIITSLWKNVTKELGLLRIG